jgi:hypothetical protein
MTPLKRFPLCHWRRWNDFRGVIDTAETDTAEMISAVSLTPLKSWWWQSEKFHRDINYRIFFAEFQRCSWHRWNRFWRLSKRLSRRIRCHMQNGFSLLIRDIYGVDWWKKNRGSKISCYCPFNAVNYTDNPIRVIFLWDLKQSVFSSTFSFYGI